MHLKMLVYKPAPMDNTVRQAIILAFSATQPVLYVLDPILANVGAADPIQLQFLPSTTISPTQPQSVRWPAPMANTQ